jgi:hypothetical protein
MGDDFSEAVKRALAARVGHLCSNLECRALTSGPQEEPTKAVNLGVAAHITAASPGGPRYDSKLSAEERSGHENGIWLCQNCAKHIDNDPARFTVDVLRKWKAGAEAEAKDRVGKTATFVTRGESNSIDTIDALRAVERGEKPDQETILRLRDEGLIKVANVTHMQSLGEEYIPTMLTAKGLGVLESANKSVTTAAFAASPLPDLKVYDRVRVSPIVPGEHEQSEWIVMQEEGDCFLFRKSDSQAGVEIPKSFIEKIHRFSNSKPALVQLSGRLQWVSAKRHWELFPDKPPAGPPGAYGIGKNVDVGYPTRQGILGKFGREDRLPEILGRGWLVFYDLDGKYLRWPGHEVDQILVVDWV